MRNMSWVFAAALLFFALGCESDDGGGSNGGGPAAPEPLAIMGSYVDGWGGPHEITAETWTMSMMGVFHITTWDNEAGWLVAYNDDENEYSAGLWSRMDWTFVGDDLYFCQTAYDADSEEAALATSPADPSDPENGGCGGFPWSQLMPAPLA